MHTKTTKKLGNKKGQTLVAIVALMLIALVIGIGVSSRYISNIKTLVRSDDSSKAQSIAEAGVERMLIIPDATLSDYIDFNSCGSNCLFQITDISGEAIVANVTLSYAGNSAEAFEADLSTASVFQLNLSGFPTDRTVDVCWNTLSSMYVSYIYESGGKTLSDAYAYNAAGSNGYDNGFSSAVARGGYLSCFSVNTTGTPIMLRARPYYLDSVVYFVPASGTSIPKQGILITSTGTANGTTKKVTALKTSSVLPSLFDYAIYQKSDTDALSNINQ